MTAVTIYPRGLAFVDIAMLVLALIHTPQHSLPSEELCQYAYGLAP